MTHTYHPQQMLLPQTAGTHWLIQPSFCTKNTATNIHYNYNYLQQSFYMCELARISYGDSVCPSVCLSVCPGVMTQYRLKTRW